MNKALKAIATKHSALDGEVTFYMLPYTPLAYQEGLRRLFEGEVVQLRDGKYWGSLDVLNWLSSVSTTVDIEFADGVLSQDAQTLHLYWNHAGVDVCDNWQFAQHCLTEEALTAWTEAYNDTRGATATEEEQNTGSDDDPKAASGIS